MSDLKFSPFSPYSVFCDLNNLYLLYSCCHLYDNKPLLSYWLELFNLHADGQEKPTGKRTMENLTVLNFACAHTHTHTS